MERRDDLRRAADALTGSVVVCGLGAYAEALDANDLPNARLVMAPDLTEEAASGGLTRNASRETVAPAAVVVAVDPAVGLTLDSDTCRTLADLAGLDAFTVAVVPGCAATQADLSAVADRVDAVLLAGGDESDEPTATDPVITAVVDFLAIVQAPGFVNLDLTDAQTVLSTGVSALGTGTASRDDPAGAVDAAFAGLPESVDPTAASAVLVDVVVDPVTSIAAATDAVGAVRGRIGEAANVIWGGAVDESAANELRIRLVVADVRHSPSLAAGDACPRCEARLSAYTFGARETLSCDACGYSDIAVRRE
ncbi:hypothetical protein [Halorubrum sp. DTA46]|uniref:hypothetical protein n=1 Tax=Halorubrum sp. DTA46 TaxID=3402162 RepID=UPI003AB0C853